MRAAPCPCEPRQVCRSGAPRVKQRHAAALEVSDVAGRQRRGQWSIRINDQWRICFNWEQGDAFWVEIVDYHRASRMTERLPNVHPGEVLREEFMRPLGLSQSALARAIRAPPRRINEIVHGRRAVTADTDLRLYRYFGLSEGLFLRLQLEHDLEEAKLRLGDRLEREVERRTV